MDIFAYFLFYFYQLVSLINENIYYCLPSFFWRNLYFCSLFSIFYTNNNNVYMKIILKRKDRDLDPAL